MRVLIISREAEAAGIAHRLVKDGHRVDLWTQKSHYKAALKGIVGRPGEWRPLVPDADLVLCDTVGFGHLAPMLSRMGKPMLGFNQFADVIELDRIKGMDTMKAVGINVPATKRCRTPEEAKKLPWESDLGYVIKPCGNISPGLTYMCPTKDIYQWALSTYKEGQELIVQDVVDGVEVSTEGWFNGRDWISPFNHTFEEKAFMPVKGAPMTGCMGNVVMTVSKPDRLCQETVMKMTNALRVAGYRGPLDVNAIVTKDKVYALEFTARFGYDAIEALMEGLQEPIADLLFETAVGIKKGMEVTNDLMIAVRVSQPPFPDDNEEQARFYRGSPVDGLTELDQPHVLFSDVMLEDGKPVAAGVDGLLLKATAFGRTIPEAKKRVYRTISNIKVVDIQYRSDIGDRVPADLALLKQWGWVNG